MKKVGIISLYGNYNYGNKLQNYALLKFVENNFNEVSVFTIYNNYNLKIKDKFKRFLKKILRTKGYIRERKFKNFNNYLNLKNYKNVQYKDYFDFIIVGSDQVWNYSFNDFNSEIMFAKKFNNCIKLSYSASIGLSKISTEKEKIFIDGLKKFNKISVREDSANSELKRIIKRNDIVTLIDPTMLLTTQEWDDIIVKPKMLNDEKYILLYFLGNLSKDKMDEIKKVAEEKKYKIIDLFNKEDLFYTCGPREFLYLEKHASLICTDSFHSSVFAILYNKPFIIFDRDDNMKNMSSRLDTLLSKFKIENRKYNGKKITKENLEHDYSEAYKILENERKKSYDFLSDALSIKDSD